MRERNETNALWRAVNSEMRAQRNREEPIYTARMMALAKGGTLDIIATLGEYGYRLAPERDHRLTVDYWPRTGTWRTISGKCGGRGWVSLLRFLKLEDLPPQDHPTRDPEAPSNEGDSGPRHAPHDR